jgi:serine/threonine-protein kinase
MRLPVATHVDTLKCSEKDMREDTLVGSELAGFRLERRLGEGGMATVYAGQNILNRRIRRAIKVVRPELAARDEFVSRFVEETTILEELRHPNVVRFFGLRREGGQLLMELELLDGRALSDEASTSEVSIAKAVDWVHQASVGVAAAHDLDIVHRDLKPENLFLTKDDAIKVLDFGIARALDEADRASKVTRAGVAPGSPAYMAPEVCEGATPTKAADVYALGLTLFELILGRHPFVAEAGASKTTAQWMHAHVNTGVPRLSSLKPGVPAALDDAVARACARDPKERFASAGELANALRTIVASSGAKKNAKEKKAGASDEGATLFALPTFKPSVTTSSAAVLPPTPSGRSHGLMMGGALACVALAFAAYAVKTNADTRAELEALRAAKASESAQPSASPASPVASTPASSTTAAVIASASTAGHPEAPPCRDAVGCLTACDGGNAHACFILGTMYQNGLGVTADGAKASAFFHKACEGGHQEGCGTAGKLDEQAANRRRQAAAAAAAEAAEEKRSAAWTTEMNRCYNEYGATCTGPWTGVNLRDSCGDDVAQHDTWMKCMNTTAQNVWDTFCKEPYDRATANSGACRKQHVDDCNASLKKCLADNETKNGSK